MPVCSSEQVTSHVQWLAKVSINVLCGDVSTIFYLPVAKEIEKDLCLLSSVITIVIVIVIVIIIAIEIVSTKE